MFRYEEYYVPDQLSCFIKKLWILNNEQNPGMIPGKSVLPNGCFNIAIIKGEGLVVTTCTGKVTMKEGVYFCGQMTEVTHVDILPFTRATMIQLYSWTPVHFTSIDFSTSPDSILPVSSYNHSTVEQLEELTNLDAQQLVRRISNLFRPCLQFTKTSALVTSSVQMILESHGEITINEITDRLQCSARHLQKLFRIHIGLSPKKFAVIIKLRDAVDDMAYPAADKLSLTQLALTYNFFDQAHFTNTFQSIAGTSPKKFRPSDYLLSYKK